MIDELSKKINSCETEMTASDQEIIVVNKAGLIDDISNLLAVVFIFGIMIGATLIQLIVLLVNFFLRF